MNSRTLSLILLSAFCAQAAAQVTFGTNSASDLLSQAAEYRAQADPPAQITRLSLDKQITIEPDRIRHRVVELWYYATAADVQNYGTDRIYFNEERDQVKVTTAASVDAAGRLHRFEPDTLKLTDVDRDDTFTDTRQAVIALPGLGVGSITKLEYEIVTDRSKMAMDWSEQFADQAGFPTGHLRLSVAWPEDEAINWSSDSEWLDCREGNRSLVCEGKQIPKYDADKITNYFDEIGQVLVAEKQNWGTVVQRAMRAYRKAFDDTRGAESLLEELSAGEGDQADKIARIHQFVAQDIRYVSMSELGHAITPHSVSSVLLSRYGDCKDKSAVLQHLLQGIGVDAYPVLVATDRTDPRKLDVPSMGYFDHMVVCFDWQGETRCLDATDSYTDWRYVPAWIQGRVALHLRDVSAPSVIAPATYRWRMKVDSEFSLNDDGSADESQTRTYIGEYAGTLRGFLAGMDPEGRQEWAVNNYHQQMSDMTTPAFQFDGVEQLSPELTILSSAVYPPFVEADEPLEYLEHSVWLVNELESLYVSSTDTETEFAGLEVTTEHDFDVGRGWKLTTLSPNLDLRHDYGSMVRNVQKVNDQRLAVTTSLKIPRQILQGQEVETFNRFLDVLIQQSIFDFNGRVN